MRIDFDLSYFAINFDNFDNFVDEFALKIEYFDKYYFDNEIDHCNTIVEIAIDDCYINRIKRKYFV